MSVYPRKTRNARNGSQAGVAFYDLDGTLIDLNLVHATLYMLANLGEWTGRLRYTLGFLLRLPMLCLAEQRDRYLLNVVLFEIFRGVSRGRPRARAGDRLPGFYRRAARRAPWRERLCRQPARLQPRPRHWTPA